MAKGKEKLAHFVIKCGGADKLAKRLKVTPHTIRNWLSGRSVPTPVSALNLIKLSKNKLTYIDLY